MEVAKVASTILPELVPWISFILCSENKISR